MKSRLILLAAASLLFIAVAARAEVTMTRTEVAALSSSITAIQWDIGNRAATLTTVNRVRELHFSVLALEAFHQLLTAEPDVSEFLYQVSPWATRNTRFAETDIGRMGAILSAPYATIVASDDLRARLAVLGESVTQMQYLERTATQRDSLVLRQESSTGQLTFIFDLAVRTAIHALYQSIGAATPSFLPQQVEVIHAATTFIRRAHSQLEFVPPFNVAAFVEAVSALQTLVAAGRGDVEAYYVTHRAAIETHIRRLYDAYVAVRPLCAIEVDETRAEQPPR